MAITAGAVISVLVTFATRWTMTRQGEMLSSQSEASLRCWTLSDHSEGSEHLLPREMEQAEWEKTRDIDNPLR